MPRYFSRRGKLARAVNPFCNSCKRYFIDELERRTLLAADISLTGFAVGSGHTTWTLNYGVSGSDAEEFSIEFLRANDAAGTDLISSTPLQTHSVTSSGDRATGNHQISITPYFSDAFDDYYLVAKIVPGSGDTGSTIGFTGGIFRVGSTLHIQGTDAADSGALDLPSGMTSRWTFNGVSYSYTAPQARLRLHGGNDMFSVPDGGNSGPVWMFGGGGNDSLAGGYNTDLVSGGAGNDSLYGDLDNDILDGGTGNDTLIGGYDDDSIVGAAGDDRLIGDRGDDTLNGGGGNDTYVFAGSGTSSDDYEPLGTDRIIDPSDGGTDDTFDFSQADYVDMFEDFGDFITVEMGAYVNLSRTGTYSIFSNNYTALSLNMNGESNIENIIGTPYSDSFTGNSVSNRFDGNGGGDYITAGGGDEVEGGSGGNIVYVNGIASPGSTDVWINGSGGTTTVDFSQCASGINITLGTATYYSVGELWVRLTSVRNVIGTSFNDTLTGSAADNYLDGGGGNDSIIGNAGLDVLKGGSGNDTINGGSDNDLLDGGAGTDNLAGSDGNDLFASADGSIDTINGGNGNDALGAHDANDAPTAVELTEMVAGNAMIEAGDNYAVSLPGSTYSSISGWKIDWGDGSEIEQLSGSATSAEHVFDQIGTNPVTVTIQTSRGSLPAGTINVESKLPMPTDVFATNVNSTDITVRWTPEWEYDEVIVRQYDFDVSAGTYDPTPIGQITVSGNVQSRTFSVSSTSATYGFTAQGVIGGTTISAESSLVKNFDEPGADWTDIVYANEPGQSYVDVEWSPMNSYIDENNETVEYVGDYDAETDTVTMVVSGLPRHTWADLHGYIIASGGPMTSHEAIEFTLTVDDIELQVDPTPLEDGNALGLNKYYGFSIGENEPEPKPDAFKHDDKEMTLTIEASNIPEDWAWTPMVWSSAFIPFVSITGSGTTIEDGSELATFTAHRTGDGTVISEPLTVKVRDAGGSVTGAAKEGEDYEPIKEIVIPAGENEWTVEVEPIDDPDAEGVEPIYQSVKGDPLYMLAAPPATAPETGPTTSAVAADDDTIVRSLHVERIAWSDVPGREAASPPTEQDGSPKVDINRWFGYDFTVRITVVGEHLDEVYRKQTVHSVTRLVDPQTGVPLPMTPGNSEFILDIIKLQDPEAEAALVNNADYELDPSPGGSSWNWASLNVKPDTNNGIAEIFDEQAFALPKQDMEFLGDPVSYTYVVMRTMAFRLHFKKDLNPMATEFDPKEWGYYWTNDVCAWTDQDGAPFALVAASFKNSGIGRLDSTSIEALDDLNS